MEVHGKLPSPHLDGAQCHPVHLRKCCNLDEPFRQASEFSPTWEQIKIIIKLKYEKNIFKSICTTTTKSV